MKKLEGKVAVITGGNIGIGLAQHRGLSQTEHMFSLLAAVKMSLTKQSNRSAQTSVVSRVMSQI